MEASKINRQYADLGMPTHPDGHNAPRKAETSFSVVLGLNLTQNLQAGTR